MCREYRGLIGLARERNRIILRTHLRGSTARQHARLDAVAAVEGRFADVGVYRHFLARQHAARFGIEEWVALHCPSELAPPPVTRLILRDLAESGCSNLSCASQPFALPEDADPVGLAWAIAGSHLGNRAMLHSLRQEAPEASAHFLADERMRDFWLQLKPRLEREVYLSEAQSAARAASAVFEHFLAVFSHSAIPMRAA